MALLTCGVGSVVSVWLCRLSTSLPCRAVFHAYLSPQPQPITEQATTPMFMYIEIDRREKVVRFQDSELNVSPPPWLHALTCPSAAVWLTC